jgi:20S proteasome subunit alpha 2
MSNFGVTTFGESGELTQVRHALTAVNNGETVVGIRAKNGIVIAAEKKLQSVLIDESSIHKIDALCDYMGVSYSGIGPDFHAVVLKARKDVAKYHATYQDRITPFFLCKQIASLFQEYTQSGGVRPFGIGLIVGGFDEDQGPQIFQIEASGAYYCWKATALGRGSKEAKQFLEKTYADDMDIGDATHTAIKALKNSFEGQLTEKNLEVAIIKSSDPEKKFHILTQSEIVDLLKEVE